MGKKTDLTDNFEKGDGERPKSKRGQNYADRQGNGDGGSHYNRHKNTKKKGAWKKFLKKQKDKGADIGEDDIDLCP
jgi:hypothetical protein